MGKLEAYLKFLRSHFVEVSVAVALIMMLLVISLYFGKFHAGLSESRAVWGQFGDFIGGSLNPLFGFISIVILASTLNLQRIELRESRKTAESNNKLLGMQLDSMANQALESTFFKLLEELKADEVFKRYKVEGVSSRVFYAIIGIHRDGEEGIIKKGFESQVDYFKRLVGDEFFLGEFTQVVAEKFLALVRVSEGLKNNDIHRALIQSTFGPFLVSAITHSFYYSSKTRYESLRGVFRLYRGLVPRMFYEGSIAEDNLLEHALAKYNASKEESNDYIDGVLDRFEKACIKARGDEAAKEAIVEGEILDE